MQKYRSEVKIVLVTSTESTVCVTSEAKS